MREYCRLDRIGLVIGLLLCGIALLKVAERGDVFTDWVNHFFMAALAWRRPYSTEGFYNLPWLTWLIRPLVFLGPYRSYAAWVLLTVPLALWALCRLGMSLAVGVLYLLSPYSLVVLMMGNVDALILIGYALLDLVPSLGVLLVLVKPQDLGLALLAGRYHWWDAGVVVAVIALSLVLHGRWPLAFLHALQHGPQTATWNGAIFPYGLPVVAALVVLGFRRRDRALLAAACPFASPYVWWVSFFPLLGVLLPRLRRSEQVGLILCAWPMWYAGFLASMTLAYGATLYAAVAIAWRWQHEPVQTVDGRRPAPLLGSR